MGSNALRRIFLCVLLCLICTACAHAEAPSLDDDMRFRFSALPDETGATAQPETLAGYADKIFTAQVPPNLSAHNAYLFVDGNGNLRPDEPLTGGELRAALAALAASPDVLARLPLEGAVMTRESLVRALTGCFPEGRLEAAFAQTTDRKINRSQFARIMNCLLGREESETVRLADGAALPNDLDLSREDARQLLEACMPHAPEETGQPIDEAVLRMPWPAGFTNHCGWLYYADESGKLLRDGMVGTLAFGADGRYTSGDAELDATVASLLEGFLLAGAQAERMELLRTVFNYCRDNFEYVNTLDLEFGAVGWETGAAKRTLAQKTGNCYCFASAFWALARGLGYEAKCVSGTAFLTNSPHGWVELTLEGERYISDPQQAYVEKRGTRDFYGLDLFLIPEADWWMLRYSCP